MDSHLSCGCAHVLGDGDPGEVEEGDGEDDEGEQPAKSPIVGHLGESIWKKVNFEKELYGHVVFAVFVLILESAYLHHIVDGDKKLTAPQLRRG